MRVNHKVLVAYNLKTIASPNKSVNKCNVCLYEELENGGVNGNKNCDGGVPDGAEDTDCPAYADAACFTSAAIHTGRNITDLILLYNDHILIVKFDHFLYPD